VRIKSHWFRSDRPKSPQEIAGAAAFIAWRIAQDAIRTMRSARYELPAGERYLAFVGEFLLFLAVGADRIAHRRGDEAWRVAFTTALVRRVAEILGENEADLLGVDTAGEVRRRFVDRFNAGADDYAVCGWTDEGPDYGLLRCFAHRVAAVMDEGDRGWAVSQIIEVQGPDAAANLARAMRGLLDPSPRRSRGVHATGE